jgi:uncharacterized repeat protein (TIGR01451 family)
MRIIRGGRLRRLALVMSLGVVAALAIAGATSAHVDYGPSDSPSLVWLQGQPEFVTFCHVAGSAEDPANTVTLTLPYNAVFGQAGHFNEDGTPNAGHEQDYLGACNEEPPPVDVCPNLEGNQATVPEGYHLGEDENGRPACIQDETEDIQVTAGVTFTEATCTSPPSFSLVKTNPGLRFYNVEGPDFVDGKPVAGGTYTFTALPDEGYVVVGQSVFVHTFAAAPTDCGPPPTDVCPNIEGNQATAPSGMVKDGQGNCVTPPAPTTPTTPPTDEFMDVQVVKDATPQVQLVNGQADIAYTIRVRNNGPNQAHNVVVTDAAPGGVTFIGVTLVGGNCTVTAALLNCTLGTIGPGVERTIELSARVTQTGTYVNSATGTGDGKDTNGANNTDDASTLVTAPATPPTTTPTPPVTPKPKPKPILNICRVLKVTPGMVKASGKAQVVLARVTRSRTPVQGVAVRFTGTGFAKVVTTNRQGIARLTLTPSKAGIMLVKITSAKACNSARIGVVGVFEPPVTG